MSIKNWEVFNEEFDWEVFNEEFDHFDDYSYTSKSKVYEREGFLSDFKSLIDDYESEDHEDDSEWSMPDLLLQIGDLCNNWSVNSEHLKELIEAGMDQYDVLSVLYDETLQTEAEKEVNKIQKQFEFKDFSEALRFINQLAEICEQQNHHPEINWIYNKVKLTLTTHEAGNIVTEKDLKLSNSIDEILRG